MAENTFKLIAYFAPQGFMIYLYHHCGFYMQAAYFKLYSITKRRIKDTFSFYIENFN